MAGANISVKAVVQAPEWTTSAHFSLSNLIAHMSRELSPGEQVLPGSPRGTPRPDNMSITTDHLRSCDGGRGAENHAMSDFLG